MNLSLLALGVTVGAIRQPKNAREALQFGAAVWLTDMAISRLQLMAHGSACGGERKAPVQPARMVLYPGSRVKRGSPLATQAGTMAALQQQQQHGGACCGECAGREKVMKILRVAVGGAAASYTYQWVSGGTPGNETDITNLLLITTGLLYIHKYY